MKRLFILISLMGGMILAGCNDWLDISPRNQIRADEVFEDPDAMKDALIGVYMKLRSETTYGGELVWGNIEHLVQHWDQATDSDWYKYNYASSILRAAFTRWYKQLYTTIADANVILAEIDAKKELFEPGEYELVKGELLGLRAFCHFDLLRLFGPIPTEPGTGTVLPYVETVSIHPHTFHTYAEYITKLEKDLETAYTLMQEWDPVVTSRMASLYTGGLDAFWNDRQLRMNYYAVTAVLARFYLWTGNGAEANEKATEVIESEYYSLGEGSGMNNTDYNYSLKSEHIFAVSYTNLYEKVQAYFGEQTSYSKSKTQLAELFDGETGTFDIRYTMLWQEFVVGTSRTNTIKKFWHEEEMYGHIPLIRLSEMYLIAIETGTEEQIAELFGTFYPRRGLTPPGELSAPDLRNRILREYSREFYAEGQGFYANKRLNIENLLWTSYKGGKEIYVLPLPDDEVKN